MHVKYLHSEVFLKMIEFIFKNCSKLGVAGTSIAGAYPAEYIINES